MEFLGFSRGSLEELKGDFEELKREIKEGIREDKGNIRDNKGNIRGEVEGILNLIYGEDCMMGRQIKGLEGKMVKEKTLPQAEMIKSSFRQARARDKKFWQLAEEKFGIRRDENGLIIKEDKGSIRENKGEIREYKGI